MIMEKALKIIEDTERALQNYESWIDKVRLRFTITKEEMDKIVEQENLNLLEPDALVHKYVAIWELEKVEVFFSTKELKIKSITFED